MGATSVTRCTTRGCRLVPLRVAPQPETFAAKYSEVSHRLTVGGTCPGFLLLHSRDSSIVNYSARRVLAHFTIPFSHLHSPSWIRCQTPK